MKIEKNTDVALSRRNFIATAGAVVAGSILATGAMPQFAAAKPAEPGLLPWPWVKLDPQEAGERAFLTYHEKGG